MRNDKLGKELDIIIELATGKGCSVAELAERTDITPRTAYYYIGYLRDCGFDITKHGKAYHIQPTSTFIKQLHATIPFNASEARYVWNLLEHPSKHEVLAQSARMKLANYYGMDGVDDPIIVKRRQHNRETLAEAMQLERMVILKNYSSPHSGTVSDRLVEPFLFLNDEHDVRCYEIKSAMNKTFKLARMQDVELTDVEWTHADEHRQVFMDIFMFSGERHHIRLRLSQLAHNLLVEEYPLAEQMIQPDSNKPNHWLFEGDVASNLGIGRFILGLFNEIEVIEGDDLKTYLATTIHNMQQRLEEQANS